MTRAVRRMDEIIVEVRQVYALALTITYRTNGRRILEDRETGGRIDKLGEHDIFSNFLSSKRRNEETIK